MAAGIDCGSLAPIPYGRVEVEGTTFGSSATYICNDGYVLVGKGIRQCGENGHWSEVAPHCIGELAETITNHHAIHAGNYCFLFLVFDNRITYYFIDYKSGELNKSSQLTGYLSYCHT